jgi:hypothetical protein
MGSPTRSSVQREEAKHVTADGLAELWMIGRVEKRCLAIDTGVIQFMLADLLPSVWRNRWRPSQMP